MGKGKIKGCDPFCKDPKRKAEFAKQQQKAVNDIIAPTADELAGKERISRAQMRFKKLLASSSQPRKPSALKGEGYTPRVEKKKPRGLDTTWQDSRKGLRLSVPKFDQEIMPGESVEEFERRMKKVTLATVTQMNTIVKENKAKKLGAMRKLKQKERRLKKEEKALRKTLDRVEDDRYAGEKDDFVFGDTVDRPPTFDDIDLPSQKRHGGRMSNLEILNKALADAEKRAKAAESAANESSAPPAASLTGAASVAAFAGVRRDIESDRAEAEAAAAAEKARARPVSFEERQAMLAKARAELRQAEIEKARAQALMAYKDMKARAGRGQGGFSSLTAGDTQLRVGAMVAQRRLESVDGRNAKM